MKFVIYGNQENIKGNPLGYHRTTQGSYWNDASKRYHQWKNYVADAYCTAVGIRYWQNEKPIVSNKNKVYLHTKIFFANDSRSDPDNVQKGIADALFKNDKYVVGSYDFHFDKENPRVEVEILQ